MRKHTLAAALAVVAMSILGAERVEAQNCAECFDLGGVHRFQAYTCGPGDTRCFDCDAAPEGHIGCHAPSAEGECESSGHPVCGEGIGDFQEDLLAAVEDANTFRIVDILGRAEYYLRLALNVSESALQFHNCRGALSLHIPVSGEVLAGLERFVQVTATDAWQVVRYRDARSRTDTWDRDPTRFLRRDPFDPSLPGDDGTWSA